LKKDRVQSLLDEGWRFLDAGQSAEAVNAFGRILLQDPAHAEARRGLDSARSAAAEDARLLEVRMDEARRAVESGDRDQARVLLEQVIAGGGDRDAAQLLLDRLGASPAGPAPSAPTPETTAVTPILATPRGPSWSRRAFVMGWALGFGLLAVGLAYSWERLMESLVRTPTPRERREANDSASPEQTAGRRGGGNTTDEADQ
jgi:FimV-like protein